VPPRHLDVGPVRVARMRLEERSDKRQIVGIAFDDRVRIADRDRRHLEPRDSLTLVHGDLPQILLDVVVAEHPGDDLAWAYAYANDGRAGLAREPAGCDSRPVPGQLGGRAVRVP